MSYQTNYSNLTRLQINIDIILFSNRQFDSFFDATHTVTGVTCTHALLPVTHQSHSPFNPKRNFDSKILKLRELFAFYTSCKFTLFTKQHYFTENRKEEKKILIRWKSDLIKLHFYLTPPSLKRTFEQFSYPLPLKISNWNERHQIKL